MLVELLQATGLNKYEAEAYVALLRHGALTGYELGKRSDVPLSRSYEILERLAGKGLALVQPGDPPRYAAEAPAQFLARSRRASDDRLDRLAEALAELAAAPQAPGFWVVRGRDPILEHARGLIAGAGQSILVSVARDHIGALELVLGQARAAGRRVTQLAADARAPDRDAILLLVDERAALAGTLTPAGECQAVSSSNPALVQAVGRCFTAQPLPIAAAARPAETQALSWLAWEERKQRSLLGERHPGRGAA